MKRCLFVVLVAAACAACQIFQTEAGPSEAAVLVIRTGTSFGECVGYCVTTLEIRPDEAVFTKLTQGPIRPPDIRLTRPFDPADWARLLGTFSVAQFEALDEVYGCPDCVDQGAEWIEIETSERVKRVTFDFGADLEEIETLQKALRMLRQSFEEK